MTETLFEYDYDFKDNTDHITSHDHVSDNVVRYDPHSNISTQRSIREKMPTTTY